MSRKLNFNAPLNIQYDPEPIHDYLEDYNTVKVETFQNGREVSCTRLFSAQQNVLPGDLFKGKLVNSLTGEVKKFTIVDPCSIKFQTIFKMVEHCHNVNKRAAFENWLSESEDEEEEITYEQILPEVVTPPAPRKSLKRTRSFYCEEQLYDDEEICTPINKHKKL